MSDGERLSVDEKLRLTELYFRKGTEILDELKTLYKDGLYLTLANRAYYAVFNMAKSLLIIYGKDPVSHKGVRQLLHLHFNDERNLLSIFDELMEFRQKVDYDVFMTVREINEETAQEVLQKAETFFELACRLREGLITSLKKLG